MWIFWLSLVGVVNWCIHLTTSWLHWWAWLIDAFTLTTSWLTLMGLVNWHIHIDVFFVNFDGRDKNSWHRRGRFDTVGGVLVGVVSKPEDFRHFYQYPESLNIYGASLRNDNLSSVSIFEHARASYCPQLCFRVSNAMRLLLLLAWMFVVEFCVWWTSFNLPRFYLNLFSQINQLRLLFTQVPFYVQQPMHLSHIH